MTFKVIESVYTEYGTPKAFCVHDDYGQLYWIPRSQIKVIERIEKSNDLDVSGLVVEIPDWLIKKNSIPVFRLTEMTLIR